MNIYKPSDNRCGVVGSYCLKYVHLVLLHTRTDNLFVSSYLPLSYLVDYDIVMNFNKNAVGQRPGSKLQTSQVQLTF